MPLLKKMDKLVNKAIFLEASIKFG